jgi:predicted RNA binding protein YcfA (HicA-like mRNA interferase family)
MSKLPQVSGRECLRALEKVGFYFVRQTGSHIYMRRDEPFTQISVPNHRVLKKGMLSRIIRDAQLSVDEFLDLL